MESRDEKLEVGEAGQPVVVQGHLSFLKSKKTLNYFFKIVFNYRI